jgi:guanosine-3',5'-bis(diphosphate) 3'-diphosphatase
LFFDATIEIRGIDRSGMLHDISDVLSDQLGINIRKLTISSDNGIFEGTIEMQVHDRKDVQFIVESMKNIKDIQEVLEVL